MAKNKFKLVTLVGALLLTATTAHAHCVLTASQWGCDQAGQQATAPASPNDGTLEGNLMGQIQNQQRQQQWQQYQADLGTWRLNQQLQNQYLLEHMGSGGNAFDLHDRLGR